MPDTEFNRSEIHITGPWVLVDDLSRSEAEAFRSGDNIVYRSEADPGIPYRYGVTSYDTHGLGERDDGLQLFCTGGSQSTQ